MALTISKRLLSQSANGLPIGITATGADNAITLHSPGSSLTTTVDELYIYAVNNYSATLNVSIQLGTSLTNSIIVTPVPAKDGLTQLVPGLLVMGSATTVTAITCFVGGGGDAASSVSAGVSGVGLISVIGYVNRLVTS